MTDRDDPKTRRAEARPLRAWVLPVYGLLLGALLGLGIGDAAWQLFALHSDPVCVALTAGGTRCSGGTTPAGWAYTGGAAGAGAGLVAGVALWRWKRVPFLGNCSSCGHDWREHLSTPGSCSECIYEIDHGDPDAPAEPCRLSAPPSV